MLFFLNTNNINNPNLLDEYFGTHGYKVDGHVFTMRRNIY